MNPVRSFIYIAIFMVASLGLVGIAKGDTAKSGTCSASVAAKGAKTTAPAPKKHRTDRNGGVPVVASGDITYYGARDPISLDHGKPEAHLEMVPTMAATILPDTDGTDVVSTAKPTKEKGEPFTITVAAGE
jgi:hypothetical protein